MRERRVVPVDEDRADALGQLGRNTLRVRVEPRVRGSPVSYTHLDVYKRQIWRSWPTTSRHSRHRR